MRLKGDSGRTSKPMCAQSCHGCLRHSARLYIRSDCLSGRGSSHLYSTECVIFSCGQTFWCDQLPDAQGRSNRPTALRFDSLSQNLFHPEGLISLKVIYDWFHLLVSIRSWHLSAPPRDISNIELHTYYGLLVLHIVSTEGQCHDNNAVSSRLPEAGNYCLE